MILDDEQMEQVLEQIEQDFGCYVPEMWKARGKIANTEAWLREYFAIEGYKKGFKAGMEACEKPNKKLQKAIDEGIEV